MEQYTIKIVPEVCIPEDPEELVYFWVSMEERFLCSKFGKDGTNTPDVYGRGVTWGPQQDFWSPVPQSDHLCNQTVRINTSAWLFTKHFEKDGEMTHVPHVCTLWPGRQRLVPAQSLPAWSHLYYQSAGSGALGHDAEPFDSGRTESPQGSDTGNSTEDGHTHSYGYFQEQTLCLGPTALSRHKSIQNIWESSRIYTFGHKK